MVAQPTHGWVSQVSRAHRVSRQTVYRWTATGVRALEEALGSPVMAKKKTASLHTLVLTRVIETHASSRGMPSRLRRLHGIEISVGKIASMGTEAGHRAIRWMDQHQVGTARALALEEHDSSQRGNASLHVMDGQRGHIWATVPPIEVDGERWTLLLWSVQDQGISSVSTVSDGGRAIQEALRQVPGKEKHQRDVWHRFPVAAHVQGRLDRAGKTAHDRVSVIQRQAEREAEGRRARGRRPKATLTEQQALVAKMSSVADGVGSLCQEWHTVLEVVVPCSDRVLTSPQCHGDIDALLDLWDERVPAALPALQKPIQMLSKQIRLALPQTLLVARRLDGVQEQAHQQVGPEAVALLAWEWLRRAIRAPTPKDRLQGIAPAWRAVAQDLLDAWAHAVRASSAVEHWQRSGRPHVAVHRTLSAGMLALLAVWRHHQGAPRGLHAGLSPFQRTGYPLASSFGLFDSDCLTVHTKLRSSLQETKMKGYRNRHMEDGNLVSNVSHGFEPCLNYPYKGMSKINT